MNETTPDHNAILGPVPEVGGFFCANGFSGHGFMHSPAVGWVLDAMIRGVPSPIDVSALSLQRFRESHLLVESNVI